MTANSELALAIVDLLKDTASAVECEALTKLVSFLVKEISQQLPGSSTTACHSLHYSETLSFSGKRQAKISAVLKTKLPGDMFNSYTLADMNSAIAAVANKTKTLGFEKLISIDEAEFKSIPSRFEWPVEFRLNDADVAESTVLLNRYFQPPAVVAGASASQATAPLAELQQFVEKLKKTEREVREKRDADAAEETLRVAKQNERQRRKIGDGGIAKADRLTRQRLSVGKRRGDAFSPAAKKATTAAEKSGGVALLSTLGRALARVVGVASSSGSIASDVYVQDYGNNPELFEFNEEK